MHNLQVIVSAIANGVVEHLSLWEGWAVLIACALFGLRAAPWWTAMIVALIINPEPYGLVANLIHGRHVSIYGAAMFTLCQVVLAFAGWLLGRLVKRFR